MELWYPSIATTTKLKVRLYGDIILYRVGICFLFLFSRVAYSGPYSTVAQDELCNQQSSFDIADMGQTFAGCQR